MKPVTQTDRILEAVEDAYAETIGQMFGVLVDGMVDPKPEDDPGGKFRSGVDLARRARAVALAVLGNDPNR